WLFRVSLPPLHGPVGFRGLRAPPAATAAGILVAAYAPFRRAAPSRAAAALATAVFAGLAWYRLFQLRPDLVSIPACLLLAALLFAPERRAGPRRVGAALLLLLVWANAHSVFAVGLALALAALLGVALERALALRLPPQEPAALAPRPPPAPLAAAPRPRLLLTAVAPPRL